MKLKLRSKTRQPGRSRRPSPPRRSRSRSRSQKQTPRRSSRSQKQPQQRPGACLSPKHTQILKELDTVLRNPEVYGYSFSHPVEEASSALHASLKCGYIDTQQARDMSSKLLKTITTMRNQTLEDLSVQVKDQGLVLGLASGMPYPYGTLLQAAFAMFAVIRAKLIVGNGVAFIQYLMEMLLSTIFQFDFVENTVAANAIYYTLMGLTTAAYMSAPFGAVLSRMRSVIEGVPVAGPVLKRTMSAALGAARAVLPRFLMTEQGLLFMMRCILLLMYLSLTAGMAVTPFGSTVGSAVAGVGSTVGSTVAGVMARVPSLMGYFG